MTCSDFYRFFTAATSNDFLLLETVYSYPLCIGTVKRPNIGNRPFDNIFTGNKDIHITVEKNCVVHPKKDYSYLID
jgi:hypothetical protein